MRCIDIGNNISLFFTSNNPEPPRHICSTIQILNNNNSNYHGILSIDFDMGYYLYRWYNDGDCFEDFGIMEDNMRLIVVGVDEL